MSAPDFVAIGHVTLDRFGDEVRPGGAALYSAVTAHRLGLSAGILTSHAADYPLEAIPSRIEVVTLEAPATTVFEYDAVSGDRQQKLVSTARPLVVRDLPDDWREAPLALLAPVAQEVDLRLSAAFEDGSVGAAAQGWLRALDDERRIVTQPWGGAREVLNRVLALFVSAEDLRGHESQLTEWVQRVPVAVVTAGAAGALLYVNGERYEVRPRRTREVDPTGAGDVFAAAFLVHYQRHPDPWDAAEAATCAASLSVEGEGWSTVPDAAQLEEALSLYRARS
ncbi:MAG TPA: PfkB family carbohydrate kinase [Patescibacteria group bacterium]|nr:PfkB family carbohydrate kinase [Patescibacteria group bacterium]